MSLLWYRPNETHFNGIIGRLQNRNILNYFNLAASSVGYENGNYKFIYAFLYDSFYPSVVDKEKWISISPINFSFLVL